MIPTPSRPSLSRDPTETYVTHVCACATYLYEYFYISAYYWDRFAGGSYVTTPQRTIVGQAAGKMHPGATTHVNCKTFMYYIAPLFPLYTYNNVTLDCRGYNALLSALPIDSVQYEANTYLSEWNPTNGKTNSNAALEVNAVTLLKTKQHDNLTKKDD